MLDNFRVARVLPEIIEFNGDQGTTGEPILLALMDGFITNNGKN